MKKNSFLKTLLSRLKILSFYGVAVLLGSAEPLVAGGKCRFHPCAAALFSYKSVTFYGQNPFGVFSTAKSPSFKHSAGGELFGCAEQEGEACKRGFPLKGAVNATAPCFAPQGWRIKPHRKTASPPTEAGRLGYTNAPPSALQAATASSSGLSLHITESQAKTAPSFLQLSSHVRIHSPSPHP